MTKGYIKAAIHRMYAPPDGQLHYKHVGCIYSSNVGGINLQIRANLEWL